MPGDAHAVPAQTPADIAAIIIAAATSKGAAKSFSWAPSPDQIACIQASSLARFLASGPLALEKTTAIRSPRTTNRGLCH
jgi:hypothetical protein